MTVMGNPNTRENDFSSEQGVLLDIVSIIAEADGIDPTELTPPLFDVIDPEALERLLQNSADDVCIQFEYRGKTISVQSDKIVSISDDRRRRSRYRYHCHSCDEERIFDSREGAQAVFNEHAKQGHEVVLRRVESRNEQLPFEAPATERPSEPPEEPPETRDKQFADE